MQVLKTGTLVGWKEDVGIVMGKVTNIGAKTGDAWVWWTKDSHNLKLKWEHGPLLEVISESR